ncbi:uncharacterized protein LOC130353847 isoform X2 [Hyla sarda]|uniref:uncharacterized protein LOC130353847 isoform X2 n=1 Tax=Hyla sarda TaxID=327740 RepID=UPI0024C41C55|nr:uncharacterized protein LOC130353847 isoform X2 [Hyla sarda]
MTIWLSVAFYLFVQNMAFGKMNITQEPNLNTTEGNISRISCHWNSEDNEQVRVQWRKYISSTEKENGAALCSVRTEQSNYSEVRNNKITCNVANNTAQLTIEGVTEDDGGLYVCEVIIEIPRLNKAKGSGTRLNVQHYNEVADIRFLYLIILIIIPILITVHCLYCKRKKKKELFLDHIYGNVKRNTTKPNRKLTSQRDKKKSSV